MVDLELLRQLQPFREMNDNQLKKLEPKCEIIRFIKGNMMFTEGDSAEHL